MATPFLGEIKIISFNFPPKGWAFCNGQIMAINQNQALFALFGTTFGGDGRTTFALPNLQGRSAVGINGSGYPWGAPGGEPAHTLSSQEMPAHSHTVKGTNQDPGTASASGSLWCNNNAAAGYNTAAANAPMLPSSITMTGGGQPHENMSPYLALNFVVALQGTFPTPN